MLQPETMAFLRDLKANNNREWFHANAKRYELVKKNYADLTSQILRAMQAVDPSLATLEPKHCTFRIARDIRFSKDKTPYKTNLGIGLPTHGKKSGMAEYYVHLEEGGSFTAGGIYMPQPEQIKKVRKEIHFFFDELKEILKTRDFQKYYGDMDLNITLSRAPQGYDEANPAITYLKLKSYTASSPLPDSMLSSDTLVSHLTEQLTALRPLIEFINRGLLSEE